MSSETYHRQAQMIQQEIARLQREKGNEAGKVADYQRQANNAVQAAQRASTPSSVASRMSEAQRYQGQVATAQKRVGDIEGKIASAQNRLIDAQKSASREEDREARDREWKARRAAEERQQKDANRVREYEARMRTVTTRLVEHDRMHERTEEKIRQLSQLPEKIGVLFMASNPLDQAKLRLDEEARVINEMIRKAEHRDAVRLETRWAVQSMDILQAINEIKPTILHFSGHGSHEGELILQDANGRTKQVSKEAIVAAVSTMSDAIRLVFFNNCFSSGQAKEVVKHVDAAIGMRIGIGDDAARVFASQFYSAIGFGYSIQRAFRQAQAALLLEGIKEDSTPQLFVAEGINAAELVLVKPENEAN